jgi:hypothetical protein
MRLRHLLSLSCVAVVFALLSSAAVAQRSFSNSGDQPKINGVPASVTSFGFGGHQSFGGVPASVTSLNFGAIPRNNWRPARIGMDEGRQHRNHESPNSFNGPAYYVPYAYPVYVVDPQTYSPAPSDDSAAEENVGPDPREDLHHEIESLQATVRDYRDELRHTEVRQQVASKPTPEEPAVSQPETVLVFKDGHQLEVTNYAIVGAMLYDLSDGRTKKLALAEIDLPATVKQNDDRGVDFRVPVGVTLN